MIFTITHDNWKEEFRKAISEFKTKNKRPPTAILMSIETLAILPEDDRQKEEILGHAEYGWYFSEDGAIEIYPYARHINTGEVQLV